MLTPDEIAGLQEAYTKIASETADYLIDQIVQRVARTAQITDQTAYMIWKARELGVSEQRLKQELRIRLGLSAKQARKLFEQAAKQSYANDMARLGKNAVPLDRVEWLQRLLLAADEQTQHTLQNFTQTAGFVTGGNFQTLTQAYETACDTAWKRTSTGATDYLTATHEACRDLYSHGIRTIDYASGVHTSLEAAIRRSLIGGMGLIQNGIEDHISEELGTDGWEITAHANSAPDHEPIQGRQYSNSAYQALNNSLVRRIGTLNCGHSAFPIMLGQPPQYTEAELEKFRQDNAQGVTINGKHYTGYEATQKQRAYERAIRVQKRAITGFKAAGDTTREAQAKTRLRGIQKAYRQFSKDAGLVQQNERTWTAGYNK